MRRPFWMALAASLLSTASAPAVALAGCGDGVLEEGETCEKNEDNAWTLFGKTCEDFGYSGGTLLCQVCKYNVTQCNHDRQPGCGPDCRWIGPH